MRLHLRHSSAPRSATERRSDEARRASIQRFRAINLTTVLPLLASVGVFTVALQAQTWSHAVVLGIGVVVAMIAFERWSAGDLSRVALPCLVIGAAIWPYGVLAIDSDRQSAYLAIALVGSLTVPRLPRHRSVAAVGLVAYVAGIGALGVILDPGAGMPEVINQVIFPTGITATLTGLMFPNKGFYDVVADLEEAREREAELAVVRERMRFASDLHDIQGHTLHVVKLKLALAQKLVHSDPDRLEQELRESYTLVGDTIAQTKELAYGRRKLNIAAELENARNLLEATGIRVSIDRLDVESAGANDLLGQVLRETTTNILRHSQATVVRIALAAHSITIVNDGSADDTLPELRGLATLKRRVAAESGELTVALDDGWFRTSATFPPLPAGDSRAAAGLTGL
ncbi:sensor histidine kinase [Ornithinimicrobium faecis]|uniref:Histidine kinase n=1 Tax=Ornithinimicrobium faecis TaxID=2934158 RepID=A0ABY4YWM2_9MICO|nr:MULTISPECIES: histidine kinase [unclassified Ornithinimicrobium]USQ80865.1 histidine kinase [Ornithinimicrobium sp. HY1793]